MGVFEMAGVWAFAQNGAEKQWVEVREVGDGIEIRTTKPYTSFANLTAEQARYMARHLNKLARKIETRDAS